MLTITGSNLDGATEVESLRGKEGDAANTYFGVFDHLITAQKEDFHFHVRSRRPPLDNIDVGFSPRELAQLKKLLSRIPAVVEKCLTSREEDVA